MKSQQLSVLKKSKTNRIHQLVKKGTIKIENLKVKLDTISKKLWKKYLICVKIHKNKLSQLVSCPTYQISLNYLRGSKNVVILLAFKVKNYSF
jgi:hypothetical protein